MAETKNKWISVSGNVKEGYRCASGLVPNPEFPRGSISLQKPFFLERGLDLEHCFNGTLNISISPKLFRLKNPEFCFKEVKWYAEHPAENFSFSRCQLLYKKSIIECFSYYPNLETKIGHFHKPDTIELLAPYIEEISYGDSVELLLNPNEFELLLE